MMQLSRHIRDHRLISNHEAGHAVVARKPGIGVTSIDMAANDRYVVAQIHSAGWGAEQVNGDSATLACGNLCRLHDAACRRHRAKSGFTEDSTGSGLCAALPGAH